MKLDTLLSGIEDAPDHARRLEQLDTLSKSGRWDEIPALIDDTMLSAPAAVGSPAPVAADVVARFDGQVDRVGFYTPYLMADETLGEMVEALGHQAADADGGPDQ
jgi:hypothetical protein